MSEVIAALVGVLATAAIGFFIYLYKSTITYEIVSLSKKFQIEGDDLVLSDDWKGIEICLEIIVFRNIGRTDVENFIAHVDRTPEILGFEVSSTDTLSKEMISVQNVGTSLEVSTPKFPRGEKIEIEVSYKGPGGGRSYREIKGGGGKYRIKRKRQSDIENNSSSVILNWFLIGVLVLIFFRDKF
ncbi:hypothetical protein [Sphingopyxis sp. RIFCSPHIGHO2_12_FULL_65_19]|uniref:hypothetical protein n=1 Tax=Sphingopyxis sp. RIFCSPHIGHO2_12_FULL_65_19 TaxID=1802172 RepID=UPI0025D25195|nr:hypothetical protein [Sphingopyxis sp. RIFCSPHIGHO2_12_FULL_65_19]